MFIDCKCWICSSSNSHEFHVITGKCLNELLLKTQFQRKPLKLLNCCALQLSKTCIFMVGSRATATASWGCFCEYGCGWGWGHPELSCAPDIQYACPWPGSLLIRFHQMTNVWLQQATSITMLSKTRKFASRLLIRPLAGKIMLHDLHASQIMGLHMDRSCIDVRHDNPPCLRIICNSLLLHKSCGKLAILKTLPKLVVTFGRLLMGA